MRWGIVTGGGDCPGLNPAIRALVQAGRLKGLTFVGIQEGLQGLLKKPARIIPLESTVGLLDKGGTVIGTWTRGASFAMDDIKQAMKQEGLEGLVLMGGEGTQKIAWQLHKAGIKILGIPKTIDNDLPHTEESLGFASCVDVVSEALLSLRTTAESHQRFMILEVMGRDSGFIALQGGIAGGAHVILIPEIPFSEEAIISFLKHRIQSFRHAVLVVSEGAHPEQGAPFYEGMNGNLGGVGSFLARRLSATLGIESRYTVLGHLQRGGRPSAKDRGLATLLGVYAVDLLTQGISGKLIVWQGKPGAISYDDCAPGTRKQVPKDDLWLHAAESLGICLGMRSQKDSNLRPSD